MKYAGKKKIRIKKKTGLECFEAAVRMEFSLRD